MYIKLYACNLSVVQVFLNLFFSCFCLICFTLKMKANKILVEQNLPQKKKKVKKKKRKRKAHISQSPKTSKKARRRKKTKTKYQRAK